MKVLILAEQCNPEWASVPLEAWSLYSALSRYCNCHLVTQIRNREALLRAGLKENIDFTIIDSERIAAPASKLSMILSGGKGKGWTTGTAISSLTYYYYESLVWRKFKDKIKAKHFDLVHRITPLTPTAQSLIAKSCKSVGVPFVLGPLNGGIPWPMEFDRERRQENEWLSYVRGLYKLLPGYKSTLENSAAILCGSLYTKKHIPKKYQNKCYYIPENAINPSLFNIKKNRHAQVPIRAIFVGRLVPYKGADMVIEAAAELIKNKKLTLEIVGDGPQLGQLKKLADNLNILSDINFAGWINHNIIQEKLANSDIFTFPSIREFGGGAILEAMAIGIVPIVVRYGGPSELATEETGYFIELSSRVNIITELNSILNRICDSPSEIDKKSELAYRRVHTNFTWGKKAQDIIEIYKKISTISLT